MPRRELRRSDLLPYQERSIEFIKNNDNVACWMDLGLGKTVSTATAFADLQRDFEARHMLVVGTVRIARDVWHTECAEWEHLKHLKVVRALGTPDKRLLALQTRADIHTISRDNFVWLTEQYVQGSKVIRKWPWDTVILDESSGFRNQSAKRWKAARRVRRLFPRLIELTGTPAPNGYEGLWAQAFLMDGGLRLGKTETAYKQRWFNPPLFYEFGKWTLKPGAKEEIDAALSDIVFALRAEDYLVLPPVQFNRIRVRLSVPVQGQYRRLERHALLETFTGNKFKAVNAGVLAGKLLQLANGAMYTGENGEWELLHNEKLNRLLELLDECDGPVLIAYNFVSDLERLSSALTAVCKSNGKTWDVLKSEESVKRWNSGRTDYLLLHPASAGHGLNLQHSGSETIIWFGLTYDAELHDQLNARLTGGHRRIGKNVVVHYLVAEGTIDEDVMDALAEKKLTQDGLMRALSARAGGVATAHIPVPESK